MIHPLNRPFCGIMVIRNRLGGAETVLCCQSEAKPEILLECTSLCAIIMSLIINICVLKYHQRKNPKSTNLYRK